jgi:hypothetical protein
MWPLLVSLASAGTALQWAEVYQDGSIPGLPESKDPAVHFVAWPYCPSDQVFCAEKAWVEVGVRIDAYSARRNHPHDSASDIIAGSREDLKPLAEALEQSWTEAGILDDTSRVGHVHGLVQSIHYAFDGETTGWTDYPKFSVEHIVDEQGDCDDAAITTGALLSELGYEVWVILWKPEPGSTSSAHLSTAVSITGDLSQVKLPEGSRFVTGPDGQDLLHVDAAGIRGGCKGNVCSRLGSNTWHKEGLRPDVVVRIDDPDFDALVPISAWNNDDGRYGQRNFRDRRGGDDEGGWDELEFDEDDWEERTIRRLEDLGEDDGEAYLRRRRIDPIGDPTWTLLSILGGLFLVAVAGGATASVMRRRARAATLREKRERERF